MVARDCGIALAEAVERTGVAYEVLGFNSPFRPAEGAGMWSRREPLYMWVFKPYERRLIQCRKTMDAIEGCADGNNVDGESMLLAVDRLLRRKERRKVFMMLSDGAPEADCDFGSEHLQRHLRSAVAWTQKQGVQCVAVGIKHDGVRRFFDEHVIVNDVDELAKLSLGMLGRVLLGDRRAKDLSGLIEGL